MEVMECWETAAILRSSHHPRLDLGPHSESPSSPRQPYENPNRQRHGIQTLSYIHLRNTNS